MTMIAENLLLDREVAISISETAELASLGFGEVHLAEVMLEFARHVLLRGGTVAYGGDLRQGGFTEHLFTLAERVAPRREPIVRSYLAWPIHLQLVPQRVDDLTPKVAFERLGEATGTVDPKVFLPPVGPMSLVLWARNLTQMRAIMADRTAARILLGGRTTGSLGAIPGVVEEALVTLDRGKPLYVLGAFGGCGRLVWDALHGRETPELDIEVQERARPGYLAFYAEYNAWAAANGQPPIDYTAIGQRFKRAGVDGLRNGLSAEENARLAATVHVPEMVALVFKGLWRLFGPGAVVPVG